MASISIETEALRKEAKKWFDLADDMSAIRSNVADLWLGTPAFFIGDTAELLHSTAYRGFHGRLVSRLAGAAAEFELIGLTLRRIAAAYEEGDRVSSENFHVLEADVDRAVAQHAPGPTRSGGGHTE